MMAAAMTQILENREPEYASPMRLEPRTLPVPGEIDAGIRLAVLRFQQHGIETYESCEGGEGHSYPEPTVAFYGGPAEGWRAVGVCLTYDLPIRELRRVWSIEDRNEPTGPHWHITFRRRLPLP
jgi:hypothetical protein